MINWELKTEWDLSRLFADLPQARAKFEELKIAGQRIVKTYQPLFGDNLTGHTILSFTEDEKTFGKEFHDVSCYAQARQTKNVNDTDIEKFVNDLNDWSTQFSKDTSFADVRLLALTAEEWEKFYAEEPLLEPYRAHFTDYLRYHDHRPLDDAHAARIADIEHQRELLNIEAQKIITNEVTKAGIVTLSDGRELEINSQTYREILSSDVNRENRKIVFERNREHAIKLSGKMTEIYQKKAKLDDALAKELNFPDYYEEKLFGDEIKADQVREMNQVFKNRKTDFDPYYEFRRQRMGLDKLQVYDTAITLLDDPNQKISFEDAVSDINRSYEHFPHLRKTLQKTVTTGLIDAFPNPEHGKAPIGYCMSISDGSALIFMNYKGLIQDVQTLTHEVGHGGNDHLMTNVDRIYWGQTMYEAEIASTFNEELLLDYAIANYDHDTALAVLADAVEDYANYFTSQTLITEFEMMAHELIRLKEVSNLDLNHLWTQLSKEYANPLLESYDDDNARWTGIPHIYFTYNYYTYCYALSRAITLSLFKIYKENPQGFEKKYTAYLSVGSSMGPHEKLKKFFDIEINEQLFHDAMDVVKMRIQQLLEMSEVN